jgi:hypothetical protein
MRSVFFSVCCFSLFTACFSLSAQQSDNWRVPYEGADVTGDDVLAFWRFDDTDDSVPDSSGKGHHGKLDGAVLSSEGKFGGSLQSFPGWPVDDKRHGAVIPASPSLSPSAAFTLELWLCPDEFPEGYGECFLIDKKYVAHTDYQWILDQPDSGGMQRMRLTLGFGEESETWWSPESISLKPGVWNHLAVTYDGAGKATFHLNGRSLGSLTKPGRGSMQAGTNPLVLGDRIGSYHHGFPGRIDEIRLTRGVREFQPCLITPAYERSVYRRFEAPPTLSYRITNIGKSDLPVVKIEAGLRDRDALLSREISLAAGETALLDIPFDTKLRPDAYAMRIAYSITEGAEVFENELYFPVKITPRQPSARMPVVMWGIGGVKEVEKALPTLKDIGFTHCLGLRCDFERIREADSPVPAVTEKEYADSCAMLDLALENDLGIIIGISPGHWLSEREETERLDKDGKPYSRRNVCCNFPEAPAFAENVGRSVARTFGSFPAFTAAMIDTEVRDGTQLCFHDHDRDLYRQATGLEFPAIAVNKSGVSYSDLPDFPQDRVIENDNELLRFYRWFWKEGDGWNAFHSAVCKGLKRDDRPDFWTYFDPAVRVPPLWGSGGSVDYLSHWTYSYPDPLRMGLAADELFAMAAGGPAGQQVMKMTQIIWYRSQTAPLTEGGPQGPRSAWEDYDPDAAYITIAPAHLREAFWHKIARPVKGIMYHGWQSLVETEGKSVYRYTHPETRFALQDLIETVVKPLGPTLMQLPEAPSDVAFLESFTSTIFAGRGTYGWGGSRAADVYHMLLYAQMQPRIIYEETLLTEGLDNFRVLVLADCDVLPREVVEQIQAYQKKGGIIVGDDRLCPAIRPDIVVQVETRSGKADEDKGRILAGAARLAAQLAPVYRPAIISSDPEVLPYKRSFGPADYVFAINDKREFGSYVGQHGLVMENGVPAQAAFTLSRNEGFVYDLVRHRQVDASSEDGHLRIPITLEPGGGRMYLVCENTIDQVQITCADHASRGEEISFSISVCDSTGKAADALIPLELRITDPDGRPAEFSGFYGAPSGSLNLTAAIAANDTPGMWTLEVRELASNRQGFHFFRVD